jgi:hypothetical protein
MAEVYARGLYRQQEGNALIYETSRRAYFLIQNAIMCTESITVIKRNAL